MRALSLAMLLLAPSVTFAGSSSSTADREPTEAREAPRSSQGSCRISTLSDPLDKPDVVHVPTTREDCETINDHCGPHCRTSWGDYDQ